MQRPRLGREERLVFVVGCPRSGTTFVGRAIGGLPGFVDFGEVTPWKAALPTGPRRPSCGRSSSGSGASGSRGDCAASSRRPRPRMCSAPRWRRIRRRSRCTCVRDGRDVVCSLLERGWLNAGAEGRDDARLAYGVGAALLGRAGAARGVRAGERRAALRVGVAALRRGRASATGAGDRLLEIRYEGLASVADGSPSSSART